MIQRRRCRQVKVGNVAVGGRAPISIQSMAKTDTSKVQTTVSEIGRLESAGCEIVRVAVPDYDSAKAIGKIKEAIRIPLVADIHFNYRLALAAIANGADAVRLNPGNIKKGKEVEEVARCAKEHDIPIRVGVNSGSLNVSWVRGHGLRAKTNHDTPTTLPELMVQSALDYIKIFEGMDFYDIIISLKASDVLTTIEAYRLMAKRCDYPFHLGVTATGLPHSGLVKSAIGVGSLLVEGIGDTIRVSLTGDPVEEVKVAREILGSLGLRRFGPEVISCPGCGRCEIDLVKLVKEVERRLNSPQSSVHSTQPLKVAVMGCVVNGPGEAKDADVGIAGGRGVGIIFRSGKKIRKVKEKNLVDELLSELKAQSAKRKATT